MSGRSLRLRELDGPFLVSDLLLDPSGQVFRSLALAQCLGVLARLGVIDELAATPSSAHDLADRLRLEVGPLTMMLDVLVHERLLTRAAGGYAEYAITPDARSQLAPKSTTSVSALLSHLNDHWALWSDLEFIVQGGPHPGGRPALDDDAAWNRRVRGQYEYARRIGRPVVDAVPLPRAIRSILDVGGSHGWFSEALCRRYPKARATVVDCAPANAIGRELTWEAGLEDIITHRDGDIFADDFGGPFDLAVGLPLMFGLADDVALPLLGRIRAALAPGGLLLVPRANVSAETSRPVVPALELYLHLDSGTPPTTPQHFVDQLERSGFTVLLAQRQHAGAELCLYLAAAA